MITNFQGIIDMVREKETKTVAVACAADKEVLLAIKMAMELGVVKPLLTGNKADILSLAKEIGLAISPEDIIDCADSAESCAAAVQAVADKKAHILMKGLVDTSLILKEVLKAEYGLRQDRLLSHIALFEVPGYDRLFYVTDAAMNIAPDLAAKKQISENIVEVAHFLGISMPRVAALSAKEKADPKMPSSMACAELQKMNEAGEITGCVIQGPLALDNAVSVEAAHHKGISGEVAGLADILVTDDIDAGNILYKSLIFFARAKNAGLIVGAKVPIVLTSRADNEEAKLYSIALAACFKSSEE
jgi:phosphate butyryltransferase